MSRKYRINDEKSRKRGYIKYNYKKRPKKKNSTKNKNYYYLEKDKLTDFYSAREEFSKKIIPHFRKESNLQYWQAPTKKDLLKKGYAEFLIFLEDIHINYWEFVDYLGLIIPKSKWDGINKKRAVNKLKEILTPNLREKLNLNPEEGPSKKQLESSKIGYGDFVYAIYNHNIYLSEVMDRAGLLPHPKDAAQEAGINAHWVLEKIFLQYTREKNLQSYYEIYPSILVHKKHSDNAILRNLNFKQKIENRQSVLKLPNPIKLLNIEYYSGSDIETIIQKCKKDYQGESKFLIIVSLSTEKKKIKTPNVPYKEHVGIMNVKEFASFMGYEGQDLQDYNECIKLTREAPWNLDARKKLRELKKKAKKLLEQEYNYRQESLESDLGEEQVQSILQGTPISQKNEENESSKEIVNKEKSKEEKKQKEEVPESSNRKDFDPVIKETKEQHPFDSRFNKVEEEEDFNDPYLWISPKVRENVEENKEKLLEKVRERSVRYTDSLSGKESLNYFEKDDLETEPKNSFIKESSKKNFVENQPLINQEIGIEPAHYMHHQKEPLPDRLIFNFINFHGIIDPYTMNRIMDISASIYPHEQTIYYAVAIGSFGAITDLLIAIWYLLNRVPFNPKMGFSLLIGGIMTGILLGFTTCLPFFL